MLDKDRKNIPYLDEIMKKAVPNGRPAAPDEVAAVSLFLCGAEASYITGANIMIDEELSIGWG
jgi:NAD(P)-dependent dehydrogenase (short-subunit alcohol dehydrogenase family)